MHFPASVVIGFAHRGGPRQRSEENTLPAFERALALGADGLESDVRLTADGVPVFVHPRIGLTRSPSVSTTRRAQLPVNVPSLEDLYGRCGSDFELSLDMAEPLAVEEVIRVARRHGAMHRLWLTYWKLHTLDDWRGRWPDVHLVYPTLPLWPGRFDRLLHRLHAIQVDTVNVHYRRCSPRLIERAHTRDLRIFAWGLNGRREVQRLVTNGLDGVYCDDVQAMVAALGRSR